MRDAREEAARFYDLAPDMPDDVPFYLERLPSPEARVLELGCGTGRVTVPLARRCGHVHGVDRSVAMLEICRGKLAAAGLGTDRVSVEQADICEIRLEGRFDLVIAPFRVMQNLETDAQLRGLFRGIRRHLAGGGRCILNAFNPNRPPDRMRTEWVSDRPRLEWEVDTPEGRVTCHDVRARIDMEPLVLHPRLLYRRFIGDTLAEEVVLEIAMRCHYPEELLARVESEGFRVTGTWGGYAGEEYGTGPELVVEFARAA